MTHDAVRTILLCQALRGLGYGFAAVQLGAVLRGRGLTSAGVGLVLAAIVAGSITATMALARWAERVGRRRCYVLLYAALAACGAAVAAGVPLWLLAVVALTGALSTEVVESGPFTTLEQVMLASTGASLPEVTRGFGLYNAVATLAGAAGALLGALPADPRWFLLLVVIGALGAWLAGRLPSTVDGTRPTPGRRAGRLGPSRRIVMRLSALFAVDSLAGGFVVQAYVAYWLGVRHDASTTVIGVTFAAVGLLQTASFLVAPAVANRIGLLATMVATHIPSNVLLAAVAFAPSMEIAVALLLARACLSQMDVPTRQAYVMAIVPPSERTAAAAATNMARYVTRPAGPALAGLIQPIGVAIPFVVAAVAKTAYDVALWRTFRRVPLAGDLKVPS